MFHLKSLSFNQLLHWLGSGLRYLQQWCRTWQKSTLEQWGDCLNVMHSTDLRGGHMTWEAWKDYHWRAPRWGEGLCGHFANRSFSVLQQPEKPLSGGRWPPDEAVSPPSERWLNCCWRRCCSTWLNPSNRVRGQVDNCTYVPSLGCRKVHLPVQAFKIKSLFVFMTEKVFGPFS